MHLSRLRLSRPRTTQKWVRNPRSDVCLLMRSQEFVGDSIWLAVERSRLEPFRSTTWPVASRCVDPVASIDTEGALRARYVEKQRDLLATSAESQSLCHRRVRRNRRLLLASPCGPRRTVDPLVKLASLNMVTNGQRAIETSEPEAGVFLTILLTELGVTVRDPSTRDATNCPELRCVAVLERPRRYWPDNTLRAHNPTCGTRQMSCRSTGQVGGMLPHKGGGWCRRLPFCVRSPGRAQDAFY